MNENKFKQTIINIRSDNGDEFFSKEMNDFLSLKGITHFSSCHTPQQNGVVERKYQHIQSQNGLLNTTLHLYDKQTTL